MRDGDRPWRIHDSDFVVMFFGQGWESSLKQNEILGHEEFCSAPLTPALSPPRGEMFSELENVFS
jgi:hypothetical protein